MSANWVTMMRAAEQKHYPVVSTSPVTGIPVWIHTLTCRYGTWPGKAGRFEFVPFKEAIDSGAEAIMTAHHVLGLDRKTGNVSGRY